MELELPDNIEDCIGKETVLKENVDSNTVSTFDRDSYIFTLADKQDYHRNDNDRIRLFPKNEYPNGRVHGLATIMGYNKIKKLFQLVI